MGNNKFNIYFLWHLKLHPRHVSASDFVFLLHVGVIDRRVVRFSLDGDKTRTCVYLAISELSCFSFSMLDHL